MTGFQHGWIVAVVALCFIAVGTGVSAAETGGSGNTTGADIGVNCHSGNGTGYITGNFYDENLNRITDTVDYTIIESATDDVYASGSSSSGEYTAVVDANEYYVTASADGYQDGSSGARCVEYNSTAQMDVILQENTAPTADAGPDRTVTAGDSITLDATGSSDPDGDSLSYYWNGTRHLSGTNTATPTFDAPSVSSTTTYTSYLLVDDGNSGSDSDSVDITVEPSSSLSANDPDGDGLYEDVNGDNSVTCADPDALADNLNANWVQNNVDKFDFDGDGQVSTSDVSDLRSQLGGCQAVFEVVSIDAPSSVTQGETVTVEATLENTGDQGGTKSVEYLVSGSTVDTIDITMSSGDTRVAQFSYSTNGSEPGTDTHSISTPDDSMDTSVTVEETGTPYFEVVSLDAPTTVSQGETIFVDAVIENTGDSAGSKPIEYRFDGLAEDSTSETLDPGEQVTVTLGHEPTDAGTGEYTHGVYTDVDSSTASVTIESDNQPPVADAGPDRTVRSGETITLDGSGSRDRDGSDLTFRWQRTDSTESLTGETPTWDAPVIDAGTTREVTFTLEVQDGDGATDRETVTITVERQLNASATVSAQSQPDGESITVDSVSLSDGGFVVVHEGFTTGPVIGSSEHLAPGNHSNVRVELDEPLDAGNRTLFVVPYWDSNDNGEYDSPDDDSIDPPYTTADGSTVSAGTTVTVNEPPTADAGDSQTVAVGETTELTGSGSDPDSDGLTYAWEQVSGSGAGELDDPNDPQTTFSATGTGDVVLELTVTDEDGANDTDTVTFDVVRTTTPPTTTTTAPATTTTPTTTTTAPATTTPATTTTAPATASPPPTTTAESEANPNDPGSEATTNDDESGLPLVPLGAGIGTLVILGGATGLWRHKRNGSSNEPETPVGASDPDGGSDAGPGGSGQSAGSSQKTPGSESHDETTASGAAGVAGEESDSQTTPSSITYGDIERGDRIGSGGNADVYHATMQGPHGPIDIALKEPRIEGTISTADVEQVLEEAETWHKLDDNEHIVDVLGWDAEPLPWIAMEYMDGGNLATAPQLDYDRGVEVLSSVASAVEYAHRAGIAHGDLKPANVLFTGDPATGVAKVGDWGLAKVLLEHSRSTEGLSPAYAAPEQFQGGSQDIVGPQLTDIYQLGTVAYEVLTGEPPFEGTPFEVMEQVKTEQPTRPTEVDPSLPTAVDEILLTAMAKDPSDRYEAMLDFRRALEEL